MFQDRNAQIPPKSLALARSHPRQPCDPSPTVDRRPEAGEQPTPLLIQDGDQLIDGPMLLDDGASPASLAIGATADMDGSVIGLGLHGSPPSFERKEANRL